MGWMGVEVMVGVSGLIVYQCELMGGFINGCFVERQYVLLLLYFGDHRLR
jgi:hypothetical protein